MILKIRVTFFFCACFFYLFPFFRHFSLLSIVWLPSSQYFYQSPIKLVHGHSAGGFRTISPEGEDGIDWCDIAAVPCLRSQDITLTRQHRADHNHSIIQHPIKIVSIHVSARCKIDFSSPSCSCTTGTLSILKDIHKYQFSLAYLSAE